MTPFIDPRLGDVEDDASSTKQRSLLAIAGSLLAEISLPKLVAAWALLVLLPGVLLGIAPLVVTGWFATLSTKATSGFDDVLPLLVLAAVIALGWFGGRPLFRAVEHGFWSLHSVAVQPIYALCREALRHLLERVLLPKLTAGDRAWLRALTAAGAAVILCLIAGLIALLVWPATRWVGQLADLTAPLHLVKPVLANTVVLLSAYLAGAAFIWGIADATMPQPHDLRRFDPPPGGRIWRVAHLSDLHVVAERYGFRIESGRAGPKGNDRLRRVFEKLEAINAERPIDLILISGDMTDAGRSTEWAEFLSALNEHSALVPRTLLLPGNHDVNIADRANPARLELPLSPKKRLREIRALSVIAALQGNRTHVVSLRRKRLSRKLSEVLEPHRHAIETFADTGKLRLALRLEQVWANVFPMVLPPESEDGLGVILLNSNAETHFSFTNALGLVSNEHTVRLVAVLRQFPRARWIVALHHHLVEYPRPAKELSERIGTALINGSWFVRQLLPFGKRIVVMHGHRHVDWIGSCGTLRIVSAPSPIMNATDDRPGYFHIHHLAAGPDGSIRLLAPERVEIAGEAAAS
jgi:predicted MPP superfamily phosphohydrolase